MPIKLHDIDAEELAQVIAFEEPLSKIIPSITLDQQKALQIELERLLKAAELDFHTKDTPR